MTRSILITLLGAALLGACATKSESGEADDQGGSSSSGDAVTPVVSTTTTTAPADGGSLGPGLPGDCLSCSFILGFAGMGDGGMMPPADGGGMPTPELCEGADALLGALVECGCAGACAETCAGACGVEFGIQSIACFSCAVEDSACSDLVGACEADDPTQLEEIYQAEFAR